MLPSAPWCSRSGQSLPESRLSLAQHLMMNEGSSPDKPESHRNRGLEALNNQAKPSTSISHQRGRLPPEIIDMIIGMLRTKRGVLTTCALVCKSWLPASRHHLYSHVTIGPRNNPDICRLFTVAPWIGSVVKHLTLEVMEYLTELHEVIRRLSNVRRLSIEDSAVVTMDFSQPAWVSLFQNLESLEFTRVDFDTPGTFLTLLCWSPRLWDLRCDHVSVVTTTDHSVWNPVLTYQDILVPELKLLYVRRTSHSLCLAMARLAITALRFTTLVLDLDPDFEVDISWERLLRAFGSRLQDLQLSRISDDMPHLAASFAFLTQLRSICLSFKYDFPEPLKFVVDALRSLKSPHLEELTVVLSSLGPNQLDEVMWSELDLLLESPRFAPTLRAITFRAPHDAFRSQEGLMVAAARDQWIAERLPLCAARGIVRSMSPFLGDEE